MRGIAGALIGLGIAMGTPTVAMADECAAVIAPPAPLEAWVEAHASVTAGGDGVTAARAMLQTGKAADAALLPLAQVKFVLAPEKAAKAGTYGGLFTLAVPRAATYRIALGAGAWVDVAAGGRTIASVAHGHGPACSGVRKIVDFPLEPGRYVVQISGASEARITLLAAPVK